LTRELAIEQVFAHAKKPASSIRLRGQWLCELGFKPGSRVKVIPLDRGAIVLRAMAPSTPA